MYVIKNDHRNAYQTHDGWTTIDNGILNGLHNVARFTEREMEMNKDSLPSGSRFIYFPERRWRDIK